MMGIEVALVIAGRTLFQVGEGEWIGEAWLVVGLAIVGGWLLRAPGGWDHGADPCRITR